MTDPLIETMNGLIEKYNRVENVLARQEKRMNDQEINEAVARKLGFGEFIDQSVLNGGNLDWSPKDYCHSIEAAWEIFDHLISIGGDGGILFDKVSKRWQAALTNSKQVGANDSIESADTAPMAICKAFLKLP